MVRTILLELLTLKDVPATFKGKRQNGNKRKRLDFNLILFK